MFKYRMMLIWQRINIVKNVTIEEYMFFRILEFRKLMYNVLRNINKKRRGHNICLYLIKIQKYMIKL